ncbi:MAG: hypothetical protein M1830_010029 [Pleopsidium flavum]|nr:MAG: hypothetical protein M1830_010029 [Pleopsidium flavum]
MRFTSSRLWALLSISAVLADSANALQARNDTVCLFGDESKAKAACAAISKSYPDQVFLPSTGNYTSESTAFWDQAAWLHPGCVVVPFTPENLAGAVEYLAKHNVTFTVRSGGHMPVAGHASLNQGVMIATTHFTEKTIVPLPNKYGVPHIRAGAAFRWQDLYEFLNPHGLVLAGGRVSSVGSSLLLGGGLSYFSGYRGWAANSVVNYEMVLANGTLVQVNNRTAPDLFWAMKGGTSNFGIVTRYDISIFSTGQMYGGTVTWATNHTQQYLDAQAAFISPGGGQDDPKAAIMPNFGYDPISKLNNSGTVLLYDGPDPNPKALENFTSIPTTFSTAKVQNFSEITASTSGYSPRDRRWSFYNIAVLSSPQTMDILYANIRNNADAILPGVNCSVGAAVQPITKSHLQAARNLGGDAIDLDPARGNFVIALIYGYWFDPRDDVKIKQWTDATLASIKKETEGKNLYYPWLFLNDAGQSQDPISTYGYGKSLAKMKAVSKMYDPMGIFQTSVPGFKLGYELHSC